MTNKEKEEYINFVQPLQALHGTFQNEERLMIDGHNSGLYNTMIDNVP